MLTPKSMPRRRQTRAAVWIGVSVLLLLVIIGVAGLVWSGLMPGLSHVAGADKQRDLGVTAAPADYEGVAERLDQVLGSASPALGVPKQVELALTEPEVSALLGHDGPLQHPQVKLHASSEVEVSAEVVTSDIPLDEIPSGVIRELIASLPDVVPVYVRGTVYVAGPTDLAMAVERMELGRLPLPAAVRDAMNQELVGGMLNQLLDSGMTVQAVWFEEGTVHLKVTVPG